jgi:hypothetical protein
MLSLAWVVMPTPLIVPPRIDPDGDFTDERVLELYRLFSTHARTTSLAGFVCDPAIVDDM